MNVAVKGCSASDVWGGRAKWSSHLLEIQQKGNWLIFCYIRLLLLYSISEHPLNGDLSLLCKPTLWRLGYHGDEREIIYWSFNGEQMSECNFSLQVMCRNHVFPRTFNHGSTLSPVSPSLVPWIHLLPALFMCFPPPFYQADGRILLPFCSCFWSFSETNLVFLPGPMWP